CSSTAPAATVISTLSLHDALPISGFGEYRLASVDAQQRNAELLLHARHGVADRGLRAMQDFGGLGEAPVVDHCLQGSPLIEGYTRRFHSVVFLLLLSGRLASA